MRRYFRLLSPFTLLLAACSTISDDGFAPCHVDHSVRVKSHCAGFRRSGGEDLRPRSGARGYGFGSARRRAVRARRGHAAEVTFDVPYKDYSWMAYLAKAGFDVFSMDMTGYGRSTRPPAMSDPCNFSKAQQAQVCPEPHSVPVRAFASLAPSRRWIRTGTTSERSSITCARCVAGQGIDRGWFASGPRGAGYAARTLRRWRAWCARACLHFARPPSSAKPASASKPGSISNRARDQPPIYPPGTSKRANWASDNRVGCPRSTDDRVVLLLMSPVLAELS